MDLPERYSLRTFANVRQGNLLIYRSTHFEALMFSITYCLKKRVCVYCNKIMHRKNCTLDHRYPIDLGGISIPNNLFPCCSDCNATKSNLTHEEYLVLRELPIPEQYPFRVYAESVTEMFRQEIGFRLPDDWVTFESIFGVSYHRQVHEIQGLRYKKISEHYDKYGTLPRPVILDCNNRLLDGYNIIFFAREHRIEHIPVISLENVSYLTERQIFVEFDARTAKNQ